MFLGRVPESRSGMCCLLRPHCDWDKLDSYFCEDREEGGAWSDKLYPRTDVPQLIAMATQDRPLFMDLLRWTRSIGLSNSSKNKGNRNLGFVVVMFNS